MGHPAGQNARSLGTGVVSPRLDLVGALSWVLCAVTLLLAAFGLLLSMVNGLSLAAVFAQYLAVNVTTAVSFATVGALIVAQRPENRIGWLLGLIGLLSAATAFAGPYARYTLLTEPGDLPGGALAAWVNLWLWVLPLTLAALFLPLLFPDGRLPSPRWRPLGWLAAAVTALFVAVVAVDAGPDPSLPEVQNPLPAAGASPLLDLADVLLAPLLVASIVVSATAIVLRFRRSRGEERRQVEWFTYAVALVLAVTLVPVLLRLMGHEFSGTLLVGVLQAAVLPSVPVAVGIAVLRHRLYEIDVLVQRTFVYGALSLCVVALYVVVVGYLGALFETDDSIAVSLIATGLVAVVFQPLRERLQQAVNRLLYGQRDDPYAVLSRLAQRLETAVAPEVVLSTIVDTVREALKVPYAAVALGRDEQAVIEAVSGERTSDPLRLSLNYQGEAVGELILGRRSGEHGFSARDRLLLNDLARQCGVAVHAVRVTADLQRSRERVIAAREEERRRLRRELHDGLGPRLAGLTLRLETARDRLAADTHTAAVLGDLAERTRDAVADVRRVVYGLRPPALDDLGLVLALQETAAQYSEDGGLDITIEAPAGLPPLPAAVEAAAYCIVQEALTNVMRHAGATRCVARLALHPTTRSLLVEVDDDGRGVDADARLGVGLSSMRERAEELGGAFSIARGVGGDSAVRAALPCRPTRQDGPEGPGSAGPREESA
jgi:signal transduction histidine kinase